MQNTTATTKSRTSMVRSRMDRVDGFVCVGMLYRERSS